MQYPKTIWFALGTLLLLLPLAVTAQDEVPQSISPVHRFSDFSEVEDAWSTLNRYENGIMATFHTNDLAPNDVVTMWWVIFNEPANCTDACGDDDIFVVDADGALVIGDNGPELNLDQIEAAQIAVLGATGNVIGDNGEGHFSAVLTTGENPNTVFGPGLLNPLTAEIHLVLRTHGPVNPDALDEQIITINGGCAAEWPNEPCQDLQFSIHQPQ
jgi:hypothetical protein